MTAAQIQARVDAWLAARSEWLATGPVRLPMLAAQWHAVSLAFGADSAAARGVLLGLVREAHGCLSLQCCQLGGWVDDWSTWLVESPPGIGQGLGRVIVRDCASECEALVAALEAAL